MKKRYIDDHPVEEWKVIEDLLPLTQFEVSSHGRVRNAKTGKYLSICKTNTYPKFSVRDRNAGVHRTLNIHRVVAVAFLSNPDNLPVVNHKDGDKIIGIYIILNGLASLEI